MAKHPLTGETLPFEAGEVKNLDVRDFHWLADPALCGAALLVDWAHDSDKEAADTFNYGLRLQCRKGTSTERSVLTRESNGYIGLNGILDGVAALILNSDDFGYAPLSVKDLVELIADTTAKKLFAMQQQAEKPVKEPPKPVTGKKNKVAEDDI